jgi:hypothetical protein
LRPPFVGDEAMPDRLATRKARAAAFECEPVHIFGRIFRDQVRPAM